MDHLRVLMMPLHITVLNTISRDNWSGQSMLCTRTNMKWNWLTLVRLGQEIYFTLLYQRHWYFVPLLAIRHQSEIVTWLVLCLTVLIIASIVCVAQQTWTNNSCKQRSLTNIRGIQSLADLKQLRATHRLQRGSFSILVSRSNRLRTDTGLSWCVETSLAFEKMQVMQVWGKLIALWTTKSASCSERLTFTGRG